MRLGVEGPLPLRSSALLPRNPTTTIYYRLAYFYSATLAWFYSALDTRAIQRKINLLKLCSFGHFCRYQTPAMKRASNRMSSKEGPVRFGDKDE